MNSILNSEIQIFQSHWWQLNSIVCCKNSTSLIWDPAYDQQELNFIIKASSKLNSTHHFLLFTHGDYDHIVGESCFPGYLKVGSERMEEKKNKKEVLKQVEETDHEFYVVRDKPLLFPDLDLKISSDHPSIKTLGGLEVHFYPAGGHTSDGLFTIIPELGLWVAGDYLSDIEFPFVEDRIDNYYHTLSMARTILDKYQIDYMIPGHGHPAISKKEIDSRIQCSENYLISLTSDDPVPDWKDSWGYSPFHRFLDKMHSKNINHVRSQSL